MPNNQIYINVQNSKKIFREAIIGLERLGFTKTGNSYAKGYIMVENNTYTHLSTNEKPSEYNENIHDCGENVEQFLKLAASLNISSSK